MDVVYNTGKHLSEHCKAEYPKLVNYCLWILAEVSVIAADIPEGWIGKHEKLNIEDSFICSNLNGGQFSTLSLR